MHFVDDLVLWVGKCFHVVVHVDPAPGTGPLVAFDEDELGRGAGGANGVDAGLVEVKDERLVHGVVFVVYGLLNQYVIEKSSGLLTSIEDDFVVRNKLLGHRGPELGEVAGRGDDISIAKTPISWRLLEVGWLSNLLSAKVVRIKDSVGAHGRDSIDGLR